jgi:hypothetical protein
MREAVKVLLGIIIFLVVLEMLDLPDWIGRKLRGEASKKEILDKISELEKRLKDLESK